MMMRTAPGTPDLQVLFDLAERSYEQDESSALCRSTVRAPQWSLDCHRLARCDLPDLHVSDVKPTSRLPDVLLGITP